MAARSCRKEAASAALEAPCGGNSHLVAQKRADGAFAIRRRTEREVYKALSGWHFDLEHPVRPSHRRASELYGLSSNVDMQLGVLGHWLRHLRPS